MAKGNDGNYLQHSIEVAAALYLQRVSANRRIHVALTHGMAPFEKCGDPPVGQTRKLLHRALGQAQEAARNSDPPIVRAYRAAGASLDHYPNTGELLRSVIGAECLSGTIMETDEQKYQELKEAWAGSKVHPINTSWRAETAVEGALRCPRSSSSAPWFFSMDPMTYSEDEFSDDNKLYRADLGPLTEAVGRLVESGRPGIAAIFVYAIRPNVRPLFWEFAGDLASGTATDLASYWITHQGGNRNLVALFFSRCSLPSDWLPEGIQPRE